MTISKRLAALPIFFRLCRIVAFCAAYSFLAEALQIILLKQDISFPNSLHGLLAFAVSILLVFRTNNCYDRWWEGRRQWGTLINTSRSLLALLQTMPGVPLDRRRHLAQEVPQLANFLREHLRGSWPKARNHPLELLYSLSREIGHWHSERWIDSCQLRMAERHLSGLIDGVGACERIRTTPLPISHRSLVIQLLFFYIGVLPWGMPHHWGNVALVAAVSYFLFGLELAAEEIEEPFGTDPDDLNLEAFCQTIERAQLDLPLCQPLEATEQPLAPGGESKATPES